MATSAQPTAAFSRDQRRAAMTAKSTQDQQNHGEMALLPSDDMIPKYLIYIYNILNLEHTRRQPPNFPKVFIPACIPGEKYAFTTLPPLVRNKFNKVGTFDYYYQVEDGRKAAGQLINPASFPGVDWNRQLVANSAETEYEITGANLNRRGVWWSLTRPQDSEQLEKEIKIFHEIAVKSMTALAKKARALGSNPKTVDDITPMMHFAMDYLGLKAPWHVDTYAIVNCPTCGEEVRQGIVYHRNSLGDRCIVDMDRALKMGIVAPAEFVAPPTKAAPAMVSTQPFDVAEVQPEISEEEIRDEENAVIARAREILEARQKAAAKKRADTIAAKKKALNSDPTAATQDVAQAAENQNAPEGAPDVAPYKAPEPDKEGFE